MPAGPVFIHTQGLRPCFTEDVFSQPTPFLSTPRSRLSTPASTAFLAEPPRRSPPTPLPQPERTAHLEHPPRHDVRPRLCSFPRQSPSVAMIPPPPAPRPERSAPLEHPSVAMPVPAPIHAPRCSPPHPPPARRPLVGVRCRNCRGGGEVREERVIDGMARGGPRPVARVRARAGVGSIAFRLTGSA